MKHEHSVTILIDKMDLFIILLMCYGISLTESQVSIPDELKICYINNNMQEFHLPMNIRVLLDIIRKVEKYSYSMMDIRTMSSSLMHRFKFDGIEYYENIKPKYGVLPYGQTAKQSIKCKLIKEMVPGQSELFPSDALTAIERCTLHQAISNTIIKQNSRDTNILCQEIGQKLTNKVIFADLWNCPREYGVILTPYGTIAPGAIIGAIAASLQHQNVELRQILSTITSERTSTIDRVDHIEEVDFIVPRDEMIRDRSMSYFSSFESFIKLDNIWLTTIAGELAEMIVYQGSILGSKFHNMELGATGFWNNTMRPNDFYLKNKNDYFDVTRAEIIGDIDGFIIASKIQTWVNDFYSLRLSQILDMYYSDEDINLFENIKICNRKKAFSHAVPKTLLDEQTYIASQLLASSNSIKFKTQEDLQELVDYAVVKFFDYANNHLLTELLCRDKKLQLQIETLIAFDGAWTKEYTMDFIAALIDDLDISMYGSKMGILHGTSGQWLLNVTNSPSLAYYVVSNFTRTLWPTRLDFVATLNAIVNYLNETWKAKWQQHIIGSFGQVIMILAPSTQFSETEQHIILNLLREIKHLYPDLYFVYYTSQRNAHFFQSFILSEQDRLILSPNIDSIVQHLSTVPRILRPVNTSKFINDSSEFKNEMEDYISPSKSITYVLHPQHIINSEKLIITIHNFGYGMIKACSWNQFDGEEHIICQQVDAHKEINLIDDVKCIDTRCPYIYFRVENVTSFNKCAEIECRLPNQVRYIIRMEHIYKNSTNKIFINTFLYLISFFIYILTVYIY